MIGPEFEDRIRENEADNPKFNFLNPNDPYHAYYQHMSKQYKEGTAQESGKIILSYLLISGKPSSKKNQGQILK